MNSYSQLENRNSIQKRASKTSQQDARTADLLERTLAETEAQREKE